MLLDSDKEGIKQKNRYKEKFGSILNNRLFILSDLNAKWKNKEMEDLFENDDALAIQKSVYKNDIEFDNFTQIFENKNNIEDILLLNDYRILNHYDFIHYHA